MKIWQYLKNSVLRKLIINIQRLSIGLKIFISFLILFLLIMLSINILILNYQKKSLKEQIDSNVSLILENLSKDVIDNLLFFDPLAIDEKISLAMNNPGMEYIMLTDKNGRVVGHSDKAQLGKYINLDFNRWHKADEEGIIHINLPVVSGDTYFGVLRAGISENKVEQYVEEVTKNLRNYIYILSSLFFVLTLFLSFMLSKTLIKPLQKLKNKMANIGTDKFELCENPINVLCKDILECKEIDCPAYGKERCWFIKEAKEYCRRCYNIECSECSVYKISCGDEIGYLIETFNEMVIKLKESLQELDRTTREKLKLEKSSAMAEMAMTVAHEIKNPLNAIKACTSYLKSNFQGEVLREFLSIIDRETERLNELITSFLSYARPMPLKYEKGNINNAVKDVIKLIQREIQEEKKILHAQFDNSIPEFYFDHHQLKQAVLNILVNALDATKEGDKITIKTEKSNGKIKITIKDSGTGIPEEIMDKIFEPFFTTKPTGSGLGLACVERIIRDHEGKINVRSKINEGTEFEIELPIRGD
ncbi:MAG: ATP-binding protein [Thermodesulfovibrio sp.]|nr:ATP-binding protein [Thermodesulfovibrio sp.]MDW7972134.1 ATP-binding protein [Thermodesulfovibrio sp.]